MRTTLTTSVVMMIALTSPAIAQDGSLAPARWLAACWELNSGNRRVLERWTEPAGGEMRGASRTIAGGREIEGERLRIYARGDTLIYDAHPSGQARTEFRGRSTSPGELVFENPAHDFPQRISYARVGSDSLIARIEGDRGGRRGPVTYAYQRVECSGFAEAPTDVVESALRVHYDDLVALLDASPGGLNAWFAKHSRPDFTYVFWATAGYRPPVVTREQVDRIASNQAAAAPSTLADRTNSAAIERTLVRGDTAEVLLAVRMAFTFPDVAGRYGPAGERRARVIEQRRLDRWVRAVDKWNLASAALVAEAVFVDGRVIQRNGRAEESRTQSADEATIRKTIEDHYFKAHASGSGESLRGVFVEEGRMFWSADGQLRSRTSTEYINGFTGKPAADEAQRQRRILMVDVTGDVAVAKAELDYPDVRLVDYFALVRAGGHWKIVNKMFQRFPRSSP